MDEQDPEILNQVIKILEGNRHVEWIDVHNENTTIWCFPSH